MRSNDSELDSLELFSIQRNMIGSSFRRFALGWVWVALAFPTSAPAELLRLGPYWHFLRFDEPCTLTNQGTKIIVEYIVNPETGRWEQVWGPSFWDETWVKDYLRFEGRSDNVHNGGTVQILKPVTIALVMFGEGKTEAEVERAPAVNIRRKTGPTTNKRPDDILQPRVAGKKPQPKSR